MIMNTDYQSPFDLAITPQRAGRPAVTLQNNVRHAVRSVRRLKDHIPPE
jgi:hypothetical protein